MLVFGLGMVVRSAGQNAVYFNELSIRNGLESGRITFVFPDSRGFTWVGTLNGLFRYDGDKVKAYGEAEGLSDPYLQSTMKEDAEGKLWFCSYTQLFFYDPVQDRCFAVQQPKNNTSLADFSLIHLEQNQYLWLTAGGKLFQADLQKIKKNRQLIVQPFQTGNQDIKGKRFTPILDAQQQLQGFWEYYRLGVGATYWHKEAGSQFRPHNYFDQEPALEINQILVLSSPNSSLLLCTTSGIYILSIRNKRLAGPYTISKNLAIRHAVHLNSREVLCSTSEGLFRFDLHHLKFAPITDWSTALNTLSFSKNGMYELTIDARKNLWTLIPEEGVAFASLNMVKSIHYPFNIKPFCSAVTTQNEVLISTNTQLYLWDGKQGLKSLKSGSRAIQIIPDPVQKMCWIRYFDQIYRFDDQTRQLTLVVQGDEKNYFWGLYPKSSQKLWLSTNNKIREYDLLYKRFTATPIKDSLTGCNHFFEDKTHQRIYFQENSDVLHIYSYQGGKWQKEKKIALKAELGNYLLPQNSKHLWIATPKGIQLIDRERLSIQTLALPPHWPTGSILNLVQDKTGTIWANTNTNLLAFKADGSPIGIYGYAEGLFAAPFQSNTLSVMNDGRIVVAGSKGLTLFSPRQMLPKRPTPQVLLTDLNVDGQAYLKVAQEDSSAVVNRVARLPYHQNSIDLRIVGVEMGAPAEVKLQYYLKGLEDHRRALILKQAAEPRYEKLAPGHYILRARAANSNGQWSPWESKLYLTIVPPIWMQPWFIALCILLVIFVIIKVIQAIYRRQLREARIRNEEQERILRDIHDLTSGKVVFFQDFQEFVSREVANQSARDKAYGIGEQALELFKRISSAVRNNTESDSTLLEFLQQLCSESKKYVSPPLNFLAKIDSSVPYAWVSGASKRQLRLIIQEALGNILKHSEASMVQLNASAQDGKLFLIITDDGKGIPETLISSIKPTAIIQESGNGLGNMLHRMQRMGGKIQWKNDQGTVVSISIPLQKIKPKRKKFFTFANQFDQYE